MVCVLSPPPPPPHPHHVLECYATFYGLILQRGRGKIAREVLHPMEKLDESLTQLLTQVCFCGTFQRASDFK